MELEFSLEVHIQNPLNSRQDAARVILDIWASVKLAVDYEYRLTGRILEMETTVTEFKPYFQTHTTKAILETQIALLQQYAG